MKFKFLDKEICYTGKELSPHWIFKKFQMQGDAAVSFIGECEVNLSDMADIADVLANSPIYSKKMLHFIIEHFNIDLIQGIYKQRFFTAIVYEYLLKKGISPVSLHRNGDDIFYNDGKLSVSIAAKSVNSVLIHFAMNIDSAGTPVKTAGLKTEMNLSNFDEMAMEIMSLYNKECDEILNASCKVKGIL